MNTRPANPETDEFLGTAACPVCGSWGSLSYWKTPEGEELVEHQCPTCEDRAEKGDQA